MAFHLSAFEARRVASIDKRRLDIVSRGHAEALEAAATASCRLDQTAEDLAHEIHRLVPSVEVSSVRRDLLAYRRHIRSRREFAHPLEQTLVPLAPSPIGRHQNAREAYLDALGKLDAHLIEHREVAFDRLRRICSSTDVADAIAIGSTDLARRLSSRRSDPDAPAIRSLYTYAVRAALKPSPLSTITRVGFTNADFAERKVRLQTHVLHALWGAIANHPTYCDVPTFQPADVAGDAFQIPRWVTVNGFAWATVESVSVEGIASEASAMRAARAGSASEIARQLSIPLPRVRRWILMGLLRPHHPWADDWQIDPLDSAIEALADTRLPTQAVENLRRIRDLTREIEGSSGEARVTHLDDVRSSVSRIFAAVNARPPSGPVLSEDAGVDIEGAEHSPFSDAFMSTLRDSITRSGVYDLLVDAFVALVRPAGRMNAVEFFHTCASDPRFASALLEIRSHSLDPQSDGPRAPFRSAGRTCAPPSVGIFYQTLGSSNRSSLVVNQCADGLGGLLTRFQHLEQGDRRVVATSLRAWLRQAYPEVAQLYEFVPNREGNSAQSLSAGLLPEMSWPGYEHVEGGSSFTELMLVHRPTQGVLEFEDRKGNLVAPIYLGLIPAWQVGGAAGLACELMNPWVDRNPAAVMGHPILRARLADESPHLERVNAGNAVLVRETWHIAVADIPHRQVDEPEPRFLVRFNRWRKERGIPHEVFYLGLDAGGAGARSVKPMWLDLRSPVSLEILLRSLLDCSSVRFQEVLPARDDMTDAVVTERLRLVRWDRP